MWEFDTITGGEQVTIALLCLALQEIGCDARSYTGAQVHILTDSAHSKARIMDIDHARVCAEPGWRAYGWLFATGVVAVFSDWSGVDGDGAGVRLQGEDHSLF